MPSLKFAYEGQKLGQRSLSSKREKCTNVKELYIFICKPISFQTKLCMFTVISLNNTENIYFVTKCSSVDFKMGSKFIKCNNQSICTN